MTKHKRPTHAKSQEEYLDMLQSGIVGWSKERGFSNIVGEQYDYEMENHLIFQGDGFLIYKTGGCEFIISKGTDWDDEVLGFFFDEIKDIHLIVDKDGEVQIGWDDDCGWPALLDYIEKAGFPIPFRLFKDYE